jgi:hypothetical protein
MANYTVTDIQKAYIAFFGRPGEPAGVDAWLSVANVTTLDHLYANFAAATEYRDYYAPYINGAGTITNIPGLLNQVYLNLFGRGVEEAGVTYWSPLLASGAITINNVVIELLNGAKNADLISVNSKLDAATAFTAAVRAAAYMGYDGPADAVIAHAWLSGVHDAASKSAAIATLPATIIALEPEYDGDEFILTSSADTVPGTNGDDTIIATNLTLTVNDHLHGRLPSASDVLKYVSDVDASHSGFFMDGVERVEVTADHIGSNRASVEFDFSGSTGIKTVASFNSVGNVAFNQLTEIPLVAEVKNVTQQGNVTVQIQNAAVAGSSDSIYLDLINNYNTGVGVITIGSVDDANSGIETVNIRTSVAASTVAKLDVDMTTLTVAGDKNLVITAPLNGTERVIDANTMTGNLTLDSTNTGKAAVSFTGSQGVDTVTFAGTTGDHTVNSGKSNDVITLGAGRDTVDLGSGNDTLHIINDNLTVLDHIECGTGNDTIVLHGSGIVDTTETFFVTGIETYTLTNSGATLYVTEKMVNTSDGGVLTVNMGADGGDTVVMTEVGTANTLNVAIKGGGNNDLVVVNDAVMAGFASLNFGSGTGDTLKIIDGATLDAGDLANVSGLDIIELSSDLSNQTWVLDLTDITTALEVRVDPNVRAAGGYSKLVVVGAGTNVKVYTTSNCAVLNADGTPYSGLASVETSLFFTEQSDTDLFGGSGDDLFTANTVDQVQVADNADGKGHNKGDRMLANFAVNDITKTVETFFSHANIHNIEILEFNPTNAVLKNVSFSANTDESIQNGDYDFNTFITGAGNDSIRFHGASTASYTADLRGGNDTVYDSLDFGKQGANHITFIGGTGNDNFVFEQNAAWDDADYYKPGEGTDTVTLEDAVDATIVAGQIAHLVTDATLLPPADGQLEKVVVNAGNDIWVVVNDADLNDFTGGEAIFNLNAGNDVVFNASGVYAAAHTEAVNVTIDAGIVDDILAVGGTGDDTITIVDGYVNHLFAVDNAVDNGGVVGLRGADTINLNVNNSHEDDVVYKTAQDGGLEGQDGGDGVQDNIFGFVSGEDKIVLSVRYTDINADNNLFIGDNIDGAYVTGAETGSGFIGDNLNKDGYYSSAVLAPVGTRGAITPMDAVTNPSTVDMQDVELALFDHTGKSDADLLSLSTIASFVSANTSLQNVDNTHNQLLLAVQSENDTAIYWFTDENGDTDASVNELSLMGIVHDAHLTTADFIYA